MLARVARNIYWLGRYLERAENTARIINVHSSLLLDLPRNTQVGWESLIAITGSDELFRSHYATFDQMNVVCFLVEDQHNPASIMNCLAMVRENLRTTRDMIPREAWEEVNNLQLAARRRLGGGLSKHARYEFLQLVMAGIQQLTGLLYSTMSRDRAYDFLRIGRYLERADMTTRIIDVRSASLLSHGESEEEEHRHLKPFDSIQWMSILKSLTAYQMYRRHTEMVRVRGADVLNFLFKDERFPRALNYCIEQLETCLHDLPANAAVLNSLARLQRRVVDADVYALAHNHEALHKFLDELQISMGWVHANIDETYFSGKIH